MTAGIACGESSSSRHVGRRPKCDEESKHNGVANVPVQAFGLELCVLILLAAKVEPDLTESKQIEVIDDERGQQHGDPSEPEETK